MLGRRDQADDLLHRHLQRGDRRAEVVRERGDVALLLALLVVTLFVRPASGTAASALISERISARISARLTVQGGGSC